jgi:hypothetical protein
LPDNPERMSERNDPGRLPAQTEGDQ